MPQSKRIAVILDADIVIESFKISAWDAIVKAAEVFIPSIIAHQEARFFRSRKGPVRIDLSPYIEDKKISVMEATVGEQANFERQYSTVFLRQDLHDGEKEALALIYAGKVKDALFCTGDHAAIRALAMVDMRDKGISLEELLRKIGFKKPLQKQFSDGYFKTNLDIGSKAFITGTGITSKKRPRGK